ncbi:MAG: hypothetical protein OXJ52_08575, partial [Oligoflexia bacterium]|nr:hypothetical protein [Oligoflexia bacterium]
MKHLLSGLISFLFIAACDNPDRPASLSEDVTVVASSQEPEYVEGIQALGAEDVKEVEISGKKYQKIDVISHVVVTEEQNKITGQPENSSGAQSTDT